MVYQSDFIVRSCCVGETGDHCGAPGRGWCFPSCCFVILQLGNLKLSYKPLLLPFRTLWEEPNRHLCLATVTFSSRFQGRCVKCDPESLPAVRVATLRTLPSAWLRLVHLATGQEGEAECKVHTLPSPPARPSPEARYPALLPDMITLKRRWALHSRWVLTYLISLYSP